jgi:hypothetical protein
VILEVVDDGKPALTSYRRVVFRVSGEPVEPPPGAIMGRRTKPVMKLTGPSGGREGQWKFYRGINLNGPALVIDGNRWEGDKADNFVCTDRQVNSPEVKLWPPTDAKRAQMIHAFRWDQQAQMKLTGAPKGNYAVYAYVWEDNNPETFTIRLNDKVVQRDYNSGREGDWERLGPWMTTVKDGTIEITSRGGAANFSGIEVWREVSGDSN